MQTDSSFEDHLKASLLDRLETYARDEFAPTLEQHLRERIEMYGQRNDYDVSILLAGLTVDVERDDDSISVRTRLPHPAYLFETGTVAHRIEATDADVLSFVWERDARTPPPQWVREEFEEEGDGWRVYFQSVEVSGLPEGRFLRDTLHWARRQLELHT